ncbi:MAG TPA: murein biosynthesis integral membrane protein MurJ [Telluria sp.]|nr:murein biosynthesis integral membrane protein MurJ [Telluria sp.]
MNLLRTLAAISSMTMLSRITGLLRESLLARAVGASAYSDAFIVAFRLPNLLRRLFAEGAFAQAFVPILSEYKTKHGQEATKTLVDHVATALIWATMITSLVGIIGAPFLVWAIATGLEKTPGAFDASVLMTRVMFPYIACMSFVALSSGILNTWSQFKVPAFTPVLLNLSFIAGALFLAPQFEQPVYAMAIAVMVGGVLQVAFQVPALLKLRMMPRIALNPMTGMRDPGVRRVLKKMGPAVFAVSAAQISLMINTGIASRLEAGSISALAYADRLMEFPTAMLGVALGTILLPGMSRANAAGDAAEYSALLNWGLRLTVMLALPAALGMALLAGPMISVLFNYGAFDQRAVSAATAPLIAYSVSLIGIVMVKILAPAFYARQDIRTPVRIAVGVLVATQLMNIVFVPLIGVAGLALSIGLGACVNAAFLYAGLRKLKVFTLQPGWLKFFLKIVVALAVMGALAWAGAHYVDWIALRKAPLIRAGALLGTITLCAGAYFSVLLLLGFRLGDFKRRGV